MTDTVKVTQADCEAAVKRLTDWITVEQMMHGDNSSLGRDIEALLSLQASVDEATRELVDASKDLIAKTEKLLDHSEYNLSARAHVSIVIGRVERAIKAAAKHKEQKP